MFGHNWTWASICCATVAAGSPSNACSAGKKGNCSAGGGKNNWSRDLVVKLQTLTYVIATSVAATANPVTEFTALRALANNYISVLTSTKLFQHKSCLLVVFDWIL